MVPSENFWSDRGLLDHQTDLDRINYLMNHGSKEFELGRLFKNGQWNKLNSSKSSFLIRHRRHRRQVFVSRESDRLDLFSSSFRSTRVTQYRSYYMMYIMVYFTLSLCHKYYIICRSFLIYYLYRKSINRIIVGSSLDSFDSE